MKKISIFVALVMIASVFATAALAATSQEVYNYIDTLNAKRENAVKAKDAAKVKQLDKMIADQKDRAAKLEAEEKAPTVEPTPTVEPVTPTPTPAPTPSTAPSGKMGLSVGLQGGLIAGMIGAQGDLTYQLPMIAQGAAVRLAGAYTQGKIKDSDASDTRLATMFLDGLYGAPVDKGMDVYGGAGLGYIINSMIKSGGTEGELCYRVFVGGTYSLGVDMGKVALELGYASMKVKNKDAKTGVSATVGYSYDF